MSTANMTAADQAREIVAQGQVPECGYDWVPFLTALLQRGRLTDESGIDVSAGVPRYEVDIPEWTAPDYRDDRELRFPDWRYAERPVRDALSRLRPALLRQDMARRPTAYARRWGIHPDQIDGRSRLSPTTAVSRRVIGALEIVLAAQSQDDKDYMAAETVAHDQVAVLRINNVLSVSIEVFETWAASKGMIPVDHIMRDDNLLLDPYAVNSWETPALNASMLSFYEELRKSVRKDEQWQRLLFKGLTTDELIAQNIHTMSNIEVNNLDVTEPLHFLVHRDMWEDTSSHGRSIEDPRFFYTLQGSRREWNASQNDELWMVIQPALQYVSRVLKQKPRVWEAIKDLRTRQPLNDELDPRRGKRATRHLMRMVAPDDIDISKCPETIKNLQNYQHFDAVGEVHRILEEKLRLRITNGHHHHRMDGRPISLGMHDRKLNQDHEGFYGSTVLSQDGKDNIEVHISAQMIWPLLVPEYSASEKLCCQFMIAVTILHELMHATHAAVAFMCGVLGRTDPNDPPPELRDLLDKVGAEVIDMSHVAGEPYYKDNFWAELGSAFEYETFGMSFGTLPAGDYQSKMIEMMPIMLEGYSYPTVFCKSEHFLNIEQPVVDFSQPIRVDWIASQFDGAWWAGEVETFGLEILTLTKPGTAHLTLMSNNYADQEALKAMLGHDNYDFFITVFELLAWKGLPILANHCKYSLWDMQDLWMIKSRLDAEHKQRQDHISHGFPVDPLPEAVEELFWAAWIGIKVLSSWMMHFPQDGFNNWRKFVPGQAEAYPHESVSEWNDRMKQYIRTYFWDDGVILQRLAILYHIYVRELGKLQRYIHEYFNQDAEGRDYLWPSDENSTQFDWVFAYLGIYVRTAADIVNLLRSISKHTNLRGTDVVDWMNHWYNIFAEFWRVGQMLHIALETDRSSKMSKAEVSDVLLSMSARVPRSAARTKLQEIQDLAVHEYNNIGLGIRSTIDDFHARINKFRQATVMKLQTPVVTAPPTPLPQMSLLSLRDVAKEYATDASDTMLSKASQLQPASERIASVLGSSHSPRDPQVSASQRAEAKSLISSLSRLSIQSC